jgi:alpha-glucosidase
MKKLLLMAWALLTLSTTLVAKSFNLSSPDGQLKAVVNVDKQITYQLSYAGTPLLQPSPLTVNVVGGKTWGEGSHLKKASTTTINQSIPTVAYKKAVVRNHCNQLSLTFREGFTLLFRAYNDGFAYRFVSNQKKGLTVKDEPRTGRPSRPTCVLQAPSKNRSTTPSRTHTPKPSSPSSTRSASPSYPLL